MTPMSTASSPDYTELMRRIQTEDGFDSNELPDSPTSRPPPPPTTVREQPAQARVTNSGFRRNPFPDQASGGWNSSTQIPRGIAKPLKHQILCRTFVPPAPAPSDRKSTTELVERLSKATISSRLKGAIPAPASSMNTQMTARRVEVDRKRLHLQHRLHPSTKQTFRSDGSSTAQGGREAIELLLYYRKEVDKRLRADPLYGLHQDIES